MRSEIRFTLFLISLGASLVAYAHVTFATKGEAKNIRELLHTIDARVYDIHTKLFTKE